MYVCDHHHYHGQFVINIAVTAITSIILILLVIVTEPILDTI